jgi:hypothetical protein
MNKAIKISKADYVFGPNPPILKAQGKALKHGGKSQK